MYTRTHRNKTLHILSGFTHLSAVKASKWPLTANERCFHPPLLSHLQLMCIFQWCTAHCHSQSLKRQQPSHLTAKLCDIQYPFVLKRTTSNICPMNAGLENLTSDCLIWNHTKLYLCGCFAVCVVNIQSLLVVFRWHPVSGVQMAFRW